MQPASCFKHHMPRRDRLSGAVHEQRLELSSQASSTHSRACANA